MSRLRPFHLLATVLTAGLVAAAAPVAATAAPLQGTVAIDGFPYTAAPIGDVNGDGFDDLGAPGGVVIWGDADPAPASASALGARGTTFPVAGTTTLPTKLGDLDHDGYDDFALGASTGAKGGYIVYGAPGRAGIPVTPGPRVAFVKSGYSEAVLRGAGDVNGDGFDDILANRTTSTAYDAGLRGGATVVFGGPRLANIDANVAGPRTMVINGSTSCKITWLIFVPVGYNCSVAIGPVSGVGDFDGDGKADLYYDTLRDDGRYVLLGRAAAASTTISAGTPAGAFIKLKPFAGSNYAGFSWRPEPAGDVNGDGKDDVIVPRYGGGLNDHAVLLGRAGLTGGTLDTGLPSYTVKADTLSQVAGVGDTNGDGADDLAVANRAVSPVGNVDTYDYGLLEGLQSQGAGGVIQPSSAVGVPGIPLARWGELTRVKVINAAGDVDGDGRADLLLPADGERTILAARGTDRVAPELTVDRSGGVVNGPIAKIEPQPLVPGPGAGSITVMLQEAATVAFTVKTAGGQTVGSFDRAMPKWQSQFAWDGKLAGQALAAGSYVLAMTPRDAAGNVGTTRTLAFSIASSGGAAPATLSVKAMLQLPNGAPLSGKVDVYLRCPDELVSLTGVSAGATVAVGGEARFAGDVCALAGYVPPTGVTGAANCFWQGAGDINGVPLGSNGQAGPLSAGANLLTMTYTCTGGVPVDVLPPERFSTGKWRSYGSANLVNGAETLTLTSKANQSGALVWPVPIDPNGWDFVMSSSSSGGNGQAEGVAMSFIPANTALPPAGPAPLGGSGGGLGIGGIPATTIALDAFKNPGDPAAAFVGIAESSTASQLNYVASADPGIRLRGNNVALKVAYKDGLLSVYVNSKLRLRRTMTLPSRAYLAISGSTGAIFQTQLIGGFNVGPYAGY